MSLLVYVIDAIKSLQDPKGSSKPAIKRRLEAEHHITPGSSPDGKRLAKTLRDAVENGDLNLHLGKYTIPGYEVPVSTSTRMTKKRVHDLLRQMGVEKPEDVSGCLKSGIQRGHVKVTGDPKDLDIVILEGDVAPYGYECTHGSIKATIRDLLYQPDYAGLDYCDGSQNATAQCKETNEDGTPCEGRMYVSFICNGTPCLDSGKGHNHCNECTHKAPFGICQGDYRNQHCDGCGQHYFAGMSVSSGCGNRRCVRYHEDRYGEQSGSDSDSGPTHDQWLQAFVRFMAKD